MKTWVPTCNVQYHTHKHTHSCLSWWCPHHTHRANSVPCHCSKRPSPAFTHTIENLKSKPAWINTKHNSLTNASYWGQWRVLFGTLCPFSLLFSLCWDCGWQPGTLCLITRANFNAYHHSTPTEKAASRSCPNTKVITDLATGGDSPQQWVMLALTLLLLISHEGPEESAHGSFTSTLSPSLYSFRNPPWCCHFSLFNTKYTGKIRAPVHPNNTPTHANDWLAPDERGRVMHGLVQIVWLQWSQSNIQTDFGQTNSYSLQNQTNQR